MRGFGAGIIAVVLAAANAEGHGAPSAARKASDVPSYSQAAAQDGSGPSVVGEASEEPSYSQAATAAEAMADLYGYAGIGLPVIGQTEVGIEAEQSSEAAMAIEYTQALVICNREFGVDPEPNAKYFVLAEVVFDDGTNVFFKDYDWFFIPPGEVDDGRFYLQKKRVVRCRFHWMNKPILGQSFTTEWVNCKPNHFSAVIMLRWKGSDGYAKPIFNAQVPLK